MKGHYEYRPEVMYVFAEQWKGTHQMNYAKWDAEQNTLYIITKYGVRKNLTKDCWVVRMQDLSIDIFSHAEFKKLFQSAL